MVCVMQQHMELLDAPRLQRKLHGGRAQKEWGTDHVAAPTANWRWQLGLNCQSTIGSVALMLGTICKWPDSD